MIVPRSTEPSRGMQTLLYTCRCVDLGSTNTSFFRTRFMDGLRGQQVGGAGVATVPRGFGEVNVTSPGVYPRYSEEPAMDPLHLGFFPGHGREPSLACRQHATGRG